MRLNRLDLIRYGRFEGAEIVLPHPADSTPDVTVIYGPNESGKSTAFNGYLELLFGMKSGTHPYAFKFERNDLLVGAELDIPGRGVMVLRRNGKRAQSLLDHQERPVEETILSSALHGLKEDDYVERFSLNDTGLREGGKRIAGAKGDLGQLLHAGVSGLTNMAETLGAMTARAEQFHKKGGRSTALKTSKDRLKEISEALKTARLTPDREKSLRKEKDEARIAFEQADAELVRARNRQAAGKAAKTWYEQTEKICKFDEILADFPAGHDLRKGMLGDVAALVTTIAERADSIAETDQRIIRHEQVIAANEADPVAEDLASQILKLEQTKIEDASLISRADTARSDLEKRTGERDELADQMDQIKARLEVTNEPLVSLVMTNEDLETLGNAAQACEATEDKLNSALDILKTAREQLGDEPAKPQDLSQLRDAFDTWQSVAEISGAEQALERENARLVKAVSELPASWPKLIENGLPARETIDETTRIWSDISSSIATATEDLETREAEYIAARARREADQGEPSSIDAAATEKTRRLRDTAWQSHRSTLSDETADRFEQAMYADDDAHINYLMGTEARKQLASSRTLEATANASFDTAQNKLNKLTEKREDLSKRVALMTTALGLSSDTSPAAFAGRLSDLSTAAEIAADVANANQRLEGLVKRRNTAFEDLSAAAQLTQINVDEGKLPERVSKKLMLQDNVREAWEKWRRGKQRLTEHEKAVAQAEENKKAALTRLETLTAALPLPDRSATSIRTKLPHLRTLQQLHREHESLARRVEALERAVTTLAKSVARLAELLDEPFDPKDDPLPIIERARKRLSKAKNADRLRKEHEELLSKENQGQARALNKLEEAQNKLKKLFEGQGGEDLQPMERAELLAERDDLRQARANADQLRNEARNRVDHTLFDEELARLPDATREAELQQEIDDAQTVRDAARDLSNEQKRLYKEAYAATDSSALITEQATIFEELRNSARQAAVAKLGVLAARGALRGLAAERRSTMLKDVEEAFVTITSNEWEKVEVWGETEGEKLVGIKKDDSRVPVEKMSTGTMGQLYFALRLAGYRSFARDPGPLPMILDDIMETFDDARASAALNLCAEIGRSGQAIIFTHHEHLVELARKSISGVAIVGMPGATERGVHHQPRSP